MSEAARLTGSRLTTPRAAAIAGIVFSVLLIISLTLIRATVPEDISSARAMQLGGWNRIRLALNLLPFAGIAFLWFIGVVRDRLGVYEDRFFATVFLGSGLLFLSLLFASAAVAGGMISAYSEAATLVPSSELYAFGRAVIYQLLTVYTMKMAAVFMISTCVMSLRTRIIPRWMAFFGLALALFLLLSLHYIEWAINLFPMWVLLISVYILIDNLHSRRVVEVVDKP